MLNLGELQRRSQLCAGGHIRRLLSLKSGLTVDLRSRTNREVCPSGPEVATDGSGDRGFREHHIDVPPYLPVESQNLVDDHEAVANFRGGINAGVFVHGGN